MKTLKYLVIFMSINLFMVQMSSAEIIGYKTSNQREINLILAHLSYPYESSYESGRDLVGNTQFMDFGAASQISFYYDINELSIKENHARGNDYIYIAIKLSRPKGKADSQIGYNLKKSSITYKEIARFIKLTSN